MDVKRYKAGTLKGELTTAEIRKLIRAHNKASSIKIPPKSSREDIIGILKNAGYMVNHEKAELRPVSKGKVQKLKVISQKTIEAELPKPKTAEEKETARKLNLKKKQDKEAELIKKGATLQRLISKKKDKEKLFKKETISNNKKDMDFKIGDTYLFKIKNKEFQGIASKINDKSVSMTFRWVNDKTLTKPIKKEDIVERLGGTDYDEDLMERYNGLR